jgi:hypothetical protein
LKKGKKWIRKIKIKSPNFGGVVDINGTLMSIQYLVPQVVMKKIEMKK